MNPDKTPLEKKLIKNVANKKERLKTKQWELNCLQDYTLKLIAKLPNRMEEIQKMLQEFNPSIYWASEKFAIIDDYTNKQGHTSKQYFYPSGKFFAKMSVQPDGKLHLLYKRDIYDLLCEGAIKINWKYIEENENIGWGFLQILIPPTCQCNTCNTLVKKYK